jgi:predicted RNA-binding protein with PIN domain
MRSGIEARANAAAARRALRTETLGPMRWFVDGMNVIGSRGDGWWRDRDRAMHRLVDLLERWAATENEDVAVFFERPPSPPIRSTVIEVTHARKPGRDAADDEIVRRLKAEAEPHVVRVVTSDRALADRAYIAGATVEGADSFRTRIEQA